MGPDPGSGVRGPAPYRFPRNLNAGGTRVQIWIPKSTGGFAFEIPDPDARFPKASETTHIGAF